VITNKALERHNFLNEPIYYGISYSISDSYNTCKQAKTVVIFSACRDCRFTVSSSTTPPNMFTIKHNSTTI